MPYQKPRSSYYVGPPGAHSAYGTRQVGQIGVHDPREIVRIERDYTSGELPQCALGLPCILSDAHPLLHTDFRRPSRSSSKVEYVAT